MTTVCSHLMPTTPRYVGITSDQNLGFQMHKSSSALYLFSKPPRSLGVMGWEVQTSSTANAQQLLGYSKNEANTTITDMKDTKCF